MAIFSINSTDPNPWFSHQHDPSVGGLLDSTVLVFDDGNVRAAADPSAHRPWTGFATG